MIARCGSSTRRTISLTGSPSTTLGSAQSADDVLAQLCSDRFGRLFLIWAYLDKKPIDAFVVHIPTLPFQQDMNTPVAIADTGLRNLTNSFLKPACDGRQDL